MDSDSFRQPARSSSTRPNFTAPRWRLRRLRRRVGAASALSLSRQPKRLGGRPTRKPQLSEPAPKPASTHGNFDIIWNIILDRCPADFSALYHLTHAAGRTPPSARAYWMLICACLHHFSLFFPQLHLQGALEQLHLAGGQASTATSTWFGWYNLIQKKFQKNIVSGSFRMLFQLHSTHMCRVLRPT